MNTTQYYLHDNFLVIQNGEYNDTFDLKDGDMNVFWEGFAYYDNAEYTEEEIGKFANLFFENLSEPLNINSHCVNSFDYTKCIIPNPKVTIEYGDDFTKDLKSRFAFFLNNRFVFAFYSDESFLSKYRGELTTNQYCKIVFESSKEVRTQLNEIIHSLNTLAKYDAN